jgi:hypothetical protein
MAKLYKVKNWEPGLPDVHFHCPGCNCDHGVWTSVTPKNHSIWGFNGSMDKPTFTPSILVRWVGLPENLEKDEKDNYV